jgi:hypothetical protein
MKNQIPNLKIGDKIGFVVLASGIDDTDKNLFFPVVEITERDNEPAYKVEFPDGTISSAAIRQSDLANRAVQIEPVGTPDMLCISERRAEFVEALERGKSSNLEVFPDWERDSFVVVNHDKGNEYRVNMQSVNSQVFAECECPDYEFRKRVCKHIGAVLVDTVLTVR